MAWIEPDRLTSAERLFLSHALILCYFTADNEEGGQEYYFVALPGERIEALHILLQETSFSTEALEEMGRIVASGEGTPSEAVRTWVEVHYNVNMEFLEAPALEET